MLLLEKNTQLNGNLLVSKGLFTETGSGIISCLSAICTLFGILCVWSRLNRGLVSFVGFFINVQLISRRMEQKM